MNDIDQGTGFFDGDERQTVFMNGLAFLALFLVAYTLTQIGILFWIDTRDFLDIRVFIVSIVVNGAVCGLLLHSWRRFRERFTRPELPDNTYRLMVVSTAGLFGASLVHVHSMGSLSSLHHLLVVAILLVVSWFLRWRDVILFFALGNLALAIIVILEARGILAYAPLFVRHQELAGVFLDWRFIAGQTVNYILVLTVTTLMVWKLRRSMERAERLLRKTNQELEMEIAERRRSEREKEELIARLSESLEQVQTLRGLLPICSHCKKIRNDEGYWMQLENYFRAHSLEIKFTHGICPECAAKYFPDLAEEKKE